MILQVRGLHCARILSRDRAGLDEAVTEEVVGELLAWANIATQEAGDTETEVEAESLKVLSLFINLTLSLLPNLVLSCFRFYPTCCSRARSPSPCAPPAGSSPSCSARSDSR